MICFILFSYQIDEIIERHPDKIQTKASLWSVYTAEAFPLTKVNDFSKSSSEPHVSVPHADTLAMYRLFTETFPLWILLLNI